VPAKHNNSHEISNLDDFSDEENIVITKSK